MRPDLGFTVRGNVAGRDVDITWAEDGGFDDPTGLIAGLIAAAQRVCATPTGPCYDAAASPAVVALLTAVQVLERVDQVEGTAVLDELEKLVAVPEGASA